MASYQAFAQADKQLTVIDTVNTADKYIKIVLYDDHTWDYIDFGRPVIDEATFYDNWDTLNIYSYKDLSVSSLPDETDLALVDSLHNYFPPYIKEVYSGFKPRRSRNHNGVDLPLNTGDTVRAAFDGVVRVSDYSKNTGGYGNLIIIRHPNGLETYYGHLSKRFVDQNEPVKAGEIIGLGGSTGRSTGPHLHFETRYMGKPFDPERIIDFKTGALRDSVFCLKKHYFSIYSHYGQTDDQSKAASGRVVHKIRSGDTLGGLAVKYGTSVSAICKLNGFTSKKVLRIGQNVIVR